MRISISSIVIKDRYRKDFGDIEELAANIKEVGQLVPIAVDSNYKLIFGGRRIRACQLLGMDSVEGIILHTDNPVKAEFSENEFSKGWTISERVEILKAIETCGSGARNDLEPSKNFSKVTKEKAAKQAGLGNVVTAKQAVKVVDKGSDELIRAMDDGSIAVSTAAALTELPVETQVYAAENPKEAPAIVHNHRAQGTGENEWYTPEQHIASASQVLGGIALDPATSELANKVVKAETIFTQEDNGLEQPWHGTVWLNPPYSQPAISQFAEKLASEWESGRLTAAIALTHNYTDTQWFHRLAKACTAICFTKGRIGFVNPEGKKAAPTQGQSFFYFGDKPEDFAEEFSKHGFVVEVCRGV
jgi:ParB family chromosome partitioning protein